jgi:hypothetical protein
LAPKAAIFVVFDACRNELYLPIKSAFKGFESMRGTNGVFIAFSTSPNEIATDVGNAGGPYARALASELVRPGLDQLTLFQNVKEIVYGNTGNRQRPWESNGFVQRIYLARKLDEGFRPREEAPKVPLVPPNPNEQRVVQSQGTVVSKGDTESAEPVQAPAEVKNSAAPSSTKSLKGGEQLALMATMMMASEEANARKWILRNIPGDNRCRFDRTWNTDETPLFLPPVKEREPPHEAGTASFLFSPVKEAPHLDIFITLSQNEYRCDLLSRGATATFKVGLGSAVLKSNINQSGKISCASRLNGSEYSFSVPSDPRPYVRSVLDATSMYASFTLENSPKSRQTTYIPLMGIREALRRTPCDLTVFLPPR